MDMGERLKELRLKKGATQEEVGNVIGVAKATIMKYEKGFVENLKRSSIKKLAEYFNVAPSYLMCLEDKKDELGNPVVSVPLLGTVKAGYDYLAEENWIGTVDIKKQLADTGEFFALKIHGDSMSPVLIEDDIVIVRKQDDFENGNIVVALINGNEATVKKGKKNENSILLQPLNTNYEPLIFTKEEMETIPVKIIGIVKKLDREF